MNTTIHRTTKMEHIEVKDNTYSVVQKKVPYFFLSQSCVLQFFFHIFQVVQTTRLRIFFDPNMDPTGRYTTQKRIKIIKAYFAAKSILLTQPQCRKDFGRNNIPDRRTIHCLMVRFWEIGSVVDTQKGNTVHCSA